MATKATGTSKSTARTSKSTASGKKERILRDGVKFQRDGAKRDASATTSPSRLADVSGSGLLVQLKPSSPFYEKHQYQWMGFGQEYTLYRTWDFFVEGVIVNRLKLGRSRPAWMLQQDLEWAGRNPDRLSFLLSKCNLAQGEQHQLHLIKDTNCVLWEFSYLAGSKTRKVLLELWKEGVLWNDGWVFTQPEFEGIGDIPEHNL
jgi:hypothetical protein